MNITVAGGGNIATQFAVHCADKGNCVTIFTSKPDSFSKNLQIVNKDGAVLLSAQISCATSDAEKAFSKADLIFVCVPSLCMKDFAEIIVPYVKKGCAIILVPGSGGGECAFKEALGKGCTIAGLQRVPSVARIIEYGKSVRATGYRDELHLAAMPNKNTASICKIVEGIFDIKCTPLPNYLNLTLTPSNPILHTTRLRTVFKDYSEGVVYPRLPLFYEEWSDESSRLLLKCDEEVQSICKALVDFDLSYVKSLKIHYESPTAEKMTEKISSIEGFKGLKTPCREVDGGFIPDLTSRYFTADFSYGLTIIKQIADFCSVSTPNIDETLDWYEKICTVKNSFSFADYGVFNYDDFVKLYKL